MLSVEFFSRGMLIPILPVVCAAILSESTILVLFFLSLFVVEPLFFVALLEIRSRFLHTRRERERVYELLVLSVVDTEFPYEGENGA